WFVGYTPSLVAGVWFGFDQPRQISYNASGGRLAAPAWAEIYQAGWHEPPASEFTVPPGMTSALVDPQSGARATEWCPVKQRQWFKPGIEPVAQCQLHMGPPEPQIAGEASGGDPVSRIGRILRRIIHW